MAFRKVEKMSSWRRIALHAWKDPQDPTVYGNLEINMREACRYLRELNQIAHDCGLAQQVTVTQLVVKAIATALDREPEANAIIARKRIYLRDSVDVYCQVSTDGGTDLSGVKVRNASEKSVLDIALEMSPLVQSVKSHMDTGSERAKRTLSQLPQSALGVFLRLIGFLTYDLRLNLERFGIPFDQFGGAMVSNVGSFGISHGLAPLVPPSRVPIVLLVGEITDRPLAENGEVVVAPQLVIGCTFDHRLIDGQKAAFMAAVVRDCLTHPYQELGLPSRPSSAVDRFQMGSLGKSGTDHDGSGYRDRKSEPRPDSAPPSEADPGLSSPGQAASGDPASTLKDRLQ